MNKDLTKLKTTEELTRSVQSVSSHVIWKIETFIEEVTRSKKHCTQDNGTLVPFKVVTLVPHIVFPFAISCPIIFLNLIHGLKSLPFQRWFWFWEKPEVTGCQIWVVGLLSHLWDLMFHKKTAWDVMHEQVCCHDEAANHQLPIAVTFWIIPIVSTEECSSLTQNSMYKIR